MDMNSLSRFRSGTAPYHRGRERGSLLLDSILALTIVAGVIGLGAQIVSEENRRQEDSLTAVSLRQVTVAAQNYVGENYDSLRIELFNAAQVGGDALLSIDMGRLGEAGYLPTIMVENASLTNIFQQEHTLLLRGVNRADASNPQRTMTITELDPGTTGGISPALVDRDPTNGEYEIEAILVTSGGNATPPHRGGSIVTRTELPTVGYVMTEGFASGAYGSFTLDLSEYETFDASIYPERGRFVSIVAMSNFGVLNIGEGNDVDLSPAFLRCADIDPVLDAISYNECLTNSDNEVYSNLVFNSYASTGGSEIFPGIRGLTNVACETDDPTEDIEAGRFLIDCTHTDMTGGLNVAGNVVVGDETGDHVLITPTSIRNDEITVNGNNINVGGTNAIELIPEPGVPGSTEVRMNSDRIIMNGKDLNEVILDTKVVLAGETIEKPSCPFDVNGDPMEPAVYATPIAYADARGRNIVGVRVATEDQGADWLIRMFNFIEEDFCTSVSNGVLIPIQASGAFYGNGAPNDPNCTVFVESPPGSDHWVVGSTPTGAGSDDLVDVYEISSEYGASLVQTRCVAQ